MNKQVTFGHVLSILAILVFPLIIWGVSIETRFKQVIENTKDIDAVTIDLNSNHQKVETNHLEIMVQLHNIELQLKDKKDRE